MTIKMAHETGDFPVHYHVGHSEPIRGTECDDCRTTITEQDVPIRDLVRAAVGWRKP